MNTSSLADNLDTSPNTISKLLVSLDYTENP